jgi:hypothetical protein
MMKIEGSGSISQRHGSADPDPYQNVMDPQHCYQEERESRRDASPDDIERYRFIKEQHERMEEERRKHALKVPYILSMF